MYIHRFEREAYKNAIRAAFPLLRSCITCQVCCTSRAGSCVIVDVVSGISVNTDSIGVEVCVCAEQKSDMEF